MKTKFLLYLGTFQVLYMFTHNPLEWSLYYAQYAIYLIQCGWDWILWDL